MGKRGGKSQRKGDRNPKRGKKNVLEEEMDDEIDACMFVLLDYFVTSVNSVDGVFEKLINL